jgi:hypothetical protein
MHWCYETTKMGVVARHREPARSGEAGGHVHIRGRSKQFIKNPGYIFVADRGNACHFVKSM